MKINQDYAWDVIKMIRFQEGNLHFLLRFSANKMKDDIVKLMFAYAFNLSNTFKRSNFRNRFSLKVVLKPLSNTKKL